MPHARPCFLFLSCASYSLLASAAIGCTSGTDPLHSQDGATQSQARTRSCKFSQPLIIDHLLFSSFTIRVRLPLLYALHNRIL